MKIYVLENKGNMETNDYIETDPNGTISWIAYDQKARTCPVKDKIVISLYNNQRVNCR